MEKKLQRKFDLLEAQRIQLLQNIRLHSSEELNNRSDATKWSANQIIQHLIFAEELSCKSIQAKIVTGNFEQAGILTHVRSLVLRLSLRSKLKFKAPLAVSKIPENLNFEELWLHWNSARNQLKDVLESIPDALLSKHLFKHPVAGKMTIYGGLSFMYEHVRRHQNQLKKMLLST